MDNPNVSKIEPVFDTIAAAPLLGVKPGTLEVWRFKVVHRRLSAATLRYETALEWWGGAPASRSCVQWRA
jgi:hypothetical protein